jgi:hypothetical protein
VPHGLSHHCGLRSAAHSIVYCVNVHANPDVKERLNCQSAINRQNKLQQLTVSSLLQRWCLPHRSDTSTDSKRMCCTTTNALQIDACALSPKAHMVPLSARMDPTIVELPVTKHSSAVRQQRGKLAIAPHQNTTPRSSTSSVQRNPSDTNTRNRMVTAP